jgi:hypothetical protein
MTIRPRQLFQKGDRVRLSELGRSALAGIGGHSDLQRSGTIERDPPKWTKRDTWTLRVIWDGTTEPAIYYHAFIEKVNK